MSNRHIRNSFGVCDQQCKADESNEYQRTRSVNNRANTKLSNPNNAGIDQVDCSSVDDDGTGDFGIHFTNNLSNALYSSAVAVTVDGLNPRGMVQSPSKTASAVEVRMMSMNDGSATESNVTHTEMQICGDLA